ncbi:MAG: riboflavin-specific deaminase, partial [Saprospiraceae bacterium]
ARGHTNEPGQPHAEAMALNQLSPEIEDFTMFVTLEPCSFFGRTPSCAKRVAKTTCRAVYVAMIDPHKKNQGKGIEILKAAGIEVHLGVLQTEAEADLNPFLLKE